MLSTFHTWSDNDKKLLVAKILHEINYSQASFDLIQSLIKVWEQDIEEELSEKQLPIQ